MKRLDGAHGKIPRRITLAQAEHITMNTLDRIHPMRPADLADYLWPGHRMRRQGAAGAACRILWGLEQRGAVRWQGSGWVRTEDW